jgi:hypothetical protein
MVAFDPEMVHPITNIFSQIYFMVLRHDLGVFRWRLRKSKLEWDFVGLMVLNNMKIYEEGGC